MEIEQPLPVTPETMKCEYLYKGVRCDKPAIQNSLFCSDHTNEPDIDLQVYNSLHARFRHNIDTTWTRTNFYYLVQAGFFTVFSVILASTVNQASRSLFPIDVIIGLVGLAQACLWYKSSQINSKYMKLWRGQVIKIDKVVDKRLHHTEIEEQALTSLSSKQLTNLLSITFVVGWLVLLGALLWLALAP
jgi:hypothetical protein